MTNASMAIQVLPKAERTDEVVRIVDEVIHFIKSFGLKTFVGPFETVTQGDYDELIAILKDCQEIAVKAGAPSVMSYVKISYQPDGGGLTIEDKVSKYH